MKRNMEMTRQKAESIFAKVLMDDITTPELKEALLLAIKDMHKMVEIEEIVRIADEKAI